MMLVNGFGYPINNGLCVWDGARWFPVRGYYVDSIPVGGSWVRGNKVSSTEPWSGQPKGWICTVGGTFGTLNGGATTGSITSGSAELTVSANTGLAIGNFISIAGVTGSKQVVNIFGTAITLDSVANATVTDAAVAFVTPSFLSEGNL